jgi:acyl carrier protein
MSKDEVLSLVRDHLSEELEVEPTRIEETTRFKEDLDADSLDLYELVMELEDRYGVSVSEQQATRIRELDPQIQIYSDLELRKASAANLAERELMSRRVGEPRRRR